LAQLLGQLGGFLTWAPVTPAHAVASGVADTSAASLHVAAAIGAVSVTVA
jgi:hypothetical protein